MIAQPVLWGVQTFVIIFMILIKAGRRGQR
jgi:hypothetical protein